MGFGVSAKEIRKRAEKAREISSNCTLCPRSCGVNRTKGEKGYCGAGADLTVGSVAPHFGEEPPLCGDGGAGAIFFSRCNMQCVFCQNHQISQGETGREIKGESLARDMIRLQEMGCANIEPVSPSHQLPGLLDALALAVDAGLHLPVVYNTNGYESGETLELLSEIVSVYLPDLKYADPRIAARYSDAPDYVNVARAAVLKMYSQVGELEVGKDGLARKGLIIRHLVLPQALGGTTEMLTWIRDNLPSTVALSLMSQYAPLHRVRECAELNRRITEDEYENVVDRAWDLGFENVFVQEMEAWETGIPNFELDKPFDW